MPVVRWGWVKALSAPTKSPCCRATVQIGEVDGQIVGECRKCKRLVYRLTAKGHQVAREDY